MCAGDIIIIMVWIKAIYKNSSQMRNNTQVNENVVQYFYHKCWWLSTHIKNIYIYYKFSLLSVKTEVYIVIVLVCRTRIFTPNYPFVNLESTGYGCIIKRYSEEDSGGD